MTEEEKKKAASLRTKAWRLANKEKAAAYQKEYVAKNPEKIYKIKSKYGKKYRESKKDGLFTVYLLPKENYVGMSSSLHVRLRNHTSKHNRNITGYKILGKYATKKEALEIEASYHAKGYLGRNPNFK